MARLPIVDGDAGNWGTILNTYLSVSHDTDGTLLGASVEAAGAEMAANKGAANGYASLGVTAQIPSSQIPSDVTTQRIEVAESGSVAGTRKQLNLIEGAGITISAVDDSANNRVNVTVTSTATGGVSSVNGQTDDVTLDAGDVGADPAGTAAAAVATAPAIIRYDTGTSSYPARSTVTTDGSRTVIWMGATAPPIGSGGAINDIDVWWKTP